MITWDALFTAYEAHLHNRALSTAPRVAVRNWLALFRSQCEPAEPARLTPEHVQCYRQRLLWQPGPKGRLYSSNTVDQALRMVRTFLRWASRQGHLAADPSVGLVLGRPAPGTPPRVPTPEEVAALLRVPDRDTANGLRDRILLGMLYELALTRAEAGRLDVADLDMPRSLMLVRQDRGRPPRTCALPATLHELLGLYLWWGRPQLDANPAEPALFVGRSGGRLSQHRLASIVLQCSRLAGIPGSLTTMALRRAGLQHRSASL
ncbi:MAG: tyrosine-type recombinase/integrase [Candidatus Eremiobacterota bacterium]